MTDKKNIEHWTLNIEHWTIISFEQNSKVKRENKIVKSSIVENDIIQQIFENPYISI